MDPHSFYLLDPDLHSEKLLDPDPQKMNADPTASVVEPLNFGPAPAPASQDGGSG